ncbi:hypothetical protein Leryth_025121 [Lithospermum erythrorhizon]|nr:hypothetical protein Leryth_025121 [Lithospermum erythrorhizon]
MNWLFGVVTDMSNYYKKGNFWRRDDQEAFFGTGEGLKDIRDSTIVLKTEPLELQKQLRRLESQLRLHC